ncbi:hypothetical protein Nepgr_006437 [Nepenthes gracilis]|uniref:Cation-transporting P-type ATPase N-terminal domain-containing protein n=1 Tax=Nepenthes gracilis TaxID=150966 RepID=A0AAD3S503_NEPGR|nr:hypothetical protein Nepgr_006437 [Nepenthes gracilis]
MRPPATVWVPAIESDGSSSSPSRSETSDEVLRKAQLDLNRRDSGLTCMGWAPEAKLAASVGGFNNGNPNAKETTSVEEVSKQLKCFKEDLTKEEGQRLEIFGQNKREDKKDSKFLKFLGFMWSPLSWVMEATAIMTIALANEGGKPLVYPDIIGFIDENNAGNVVAALMANLVSKTKVLRDRKWSEKEAAILVPEDLINIKLGDIVPADARLLEGDPLKINQATLTGVSLPFTKNPGDETFAGPTCKQGKIEAVVMATGIYTLCGKAAHLVDSTWSLWPLLWLQKVLTAIVLLVGGIPIAMPTVLSVTMTIEFHCLTEQGAITKRMTAIKQMAGMDVLCGNKTETLTLNKLTVDKSLIEVYPKNVDQDALVLLVTSASRVENQDPIDASVVNMLGDPKEAKAGIKGPPGSLALDGILNDGRTHNRIPESETCSSRSFRQG